jgi:hypothetical protein
MHYFSETSAREEVVTGLGHPGLVEMLSMFLLVG